MSNTYSHRYLHDILTRTKVIAAVGVSPNPIRPSYFVARYLGFKGYRVIPVNPRHSGKILFGEKVYAQLSDIKETVDMIDIFRRSEAVPAIVDEALACFTNLKTIWIQNLCPKMERQRLFGELRKYGVNTGVISSRLF